MSLATSRPIQFHLSGHGTAASGDQPYQVLELHLRFFHRLISTGVPHQIHHETQPISLGNVLFSLPLHQLRHPLFFQIYVEQLLSSLSIRPAARVVIASQVTSLAFQMAAGDRETNFHVVADIDYILVTWIEPVIPGLSNGGAILMEEETVILEEAPPAPELLRREKLEKEEEEEEVEFGDCSICLDEIDCKKGKVIKFPCGHVYHKPCIYKWLNNSNSCPLCRRPLLLED